MKKSYLRLFIFLMALSSLLLFTVFVSQINSNAQAQSPRDNYYLQQGDKWLEQTTKFKGISVKKDCATIAIAYYLRAGAGK